MESGRLTSTQPPIDEPRRNRRTWKSGGLMNGERTIDEHATRRLTRPPEVTAEIRSTNKPAATLRTWELCGSVCGSSICCCVLANRHFPVRHSTIHFHCGSRFSTNAASPSSAASVVRAVAATAAPALSSVLKCSPIVSLSIRFVS